MMQTRAVILAAGKGTRMKSSLTKVLHPVCGKPVLSYVLDITRSLKTYVVVGHGADQVRQVIGDGVEYVLQDQLLGTADAVRRVEPKLKGFKGTLLVLCGDTPLLEKKIITDLLRKHQRTHASATVLTGILKNPKGYGRIIRNAQGQFVAIREQKDASPQEDAINEINVGTYCFQVNDLFKALAKVKLNPKKKEFYLTDCIELLLAAGKKVETLTTEDETAAFGVNTRMHLAQAQEVIRQRILEKLMADGVSIVDPRTTYVEADVKIGQDTVIYPCSMIHSNVRIGQNCSIGPFARIRPGSRIADGCEVGNFTEVSRSSLGRKVFMKHFSFLGDATVGDATNIGAGTVTANYDGKNKHVTHIGKQAFIGSDSILIAPVSIGDQSIVGAGSVVKKGFRLPKGGVAVGVPARIIKRK